jgi:hypothetical protein
MNWFLLLLNIQTTQPENQFNVLNSRVGIKFIASYFSNRMHLLSYVNEFGEII